MSTEAELELVDALRGGVVRCGEGDHGEELYAVEDASDAMWRAAELIARLTAEIALAKAQGRREGELAEAKKWRAAIRASITNPEGEDK